MKESDLFPPVRRLLEELGYLVHAEVVHCDVTATKGDDLLVIELKRSLSAPLLAQAVSRQKLGASVYVAVPKPKNYRPRAFADTLYLLKKLELGLIFVNLLEGNSFAEVVLDPQPFTGVKLNPKKRAQLLKEHNSRSVELNHGGVTQQKIITGYTERCVKIACILTKFGEMSPKAISAYGLDRKDVANALRGNYYGWFYRVEKGIYALTLKGKHGLKSYPELVAYYNGLLERT